MGKKISSIYHMNNEMIILYADGNKESKVFDSHLYEQYLNEFFLQKTSNSQKYQITYKMMKTIYMSSLYLIIPVVSLLFLKGDITIAIDTSICLISLIGITGFINKGLLKHIKKTNTFINELSNHLNDVKTKNKRNYQFNKVKNTVIPYAETLSIAEKTIDIFCNTYLDLNGDYINEREIVDTFIYYMNNATLEYKKNNNNHVIYLPFTDRMALYGKPELDYVPWPPKTRGRVLEFKPKK